jgi:hypothetical protein
LENTVRQSEGCEGIAGIGIEPERRNRVRILAFKALGKDAAPIQRKELLGIVVEVGLDGGLDTVAAYKDFRARYINQSGKMLIWETRDPKVDAKIKNLFTSADKVVEKIGPGISLDCHHPRKELCA